MKTSIKYSFIIPMYNAADTIEKTLCSICAMTVSNIEIVAIDDGSSDDSCSIVEHVLSGYKDISYQLIRQTNRGVSNARNVGIMHAQGEYLIFSDSDDYFTDDIVSAIDKKLSSEDMVIWSYTITQGNASQGSNPNSVDLKGIVDVNTVLEAYLYRGFKIRLGSFAVNASFIRDTKINFDEDIRYAEDVEFILKILLNIDKALVVDGYYYCYERRQGSLINSYNLDRINAPLAIIHAYDFSYKVHSIVNSEYLFYINTGLVVLHFIYSVNSCVQHCHSIKEFKDFLIVLYKEYESVLIEIRKRLKVIKLKTAGISYKRMILLKISILLYLCVFYMVILFNKE